MIKEINGYKVEAKVSDFSSVEFTVSYELMYEERIHFFGYVKWDGCSNWNIPGDYYQLHFCGIDEAKAFGDLLTELYKWAAELMPEHKEILE